MRRITYKERRTRCKPIVIGIFVGIVAPILSLIWAIRLRSWALGLVPTVTAFSLGLIYALASSSSILPKIYTITTQIFSGILAYVISTRIKKKEMEMKKIIAQ
tara:strand:- start:247 stop:555 length:309 start_codon:yes stop_codon:yes gene_type:complete